MIVLLRWRERSQDDAHAEDVVVHAVLRDRDHLAERLALIASRNPYPLKQIGPDNWRMGPDYDPGFFGDKPMRFRAVEKAVAS